MNRLKSLTEETLKKLYPEIWNEVNLLPGETFRSKRWLFNRGLKEIPTCICGKQITPNSKGIYIDNCRCDIKKNISLEKTKKTNMDRYGVDNPAKNAEIRKKISQNNDYVKIREAYKKSMLEKYGVESNFQIESIKEQIKKTNREKYGVDNPNQSNDVREKLKKTNKEKYGTENYNQSEESKIRKTQKLIEKYKDKGDFNLEKSTVKDLYHICKTCGNEELISKDLLYGRFKYDNVFCLKCNPLGSSTTSQSHKNLIMFLEKSGIKNIVSNNKKILKKWKEIDIYLPDHNLAIEYDGIYWHNDKLMPKEQHIEKTVECNEKGIKLIHIFENEWMFKENIVKSKLLDMLNISPNIINGDLCEIKNVSSEESNNFLNENHIQGEVKSNHNVGLYYNNKLVSLMVFNKNTLLRYCNILNTNVINSFKTIINHFITNFNVKEIKYNADIRWYGNNPNNVILVDLGFSYIKTTKINYWYSKNYILHHRSDFTKEKLIKQGFDENKSVKDIMEERKYHTIWDCGEMIFILKMG